MAYPKVFIETSVFVRFLTCDDEEKYQDCERLFRLVEEGKIRPYVSNVVVMEIVFILTRHYNFRKKKVLDAVKKLLKLRNLTVREETDTPTALKLFSKHKAKYGDCLIATQVADDMSLVTYDGDFAKLGHLKTLTPAEIID